MSNQAELTFFARQETYYAGSNPEMADMSNPRGEIYLCCWVIIGENDYGDQYTYMPQVFREVDYEDAELSAIIMATEFCKRAARGDVPTLNGKIWRYRGPAYGTEAYSAAEGGIVADEYEADMQGY